MKKRLMAWLLVCFMLIGTMAVPVMAEEGDNKPSTHEEGGDTDGGGDTVGRTSVDVCDITARADGNTLNLTAELFISAALVTEHGEDAAVTLSPSEDAGRNIPAGRNKIRVYIPDRGESAWDVEKKFRLGCDAVREGEAYVI